MTCMTLTFYLELGMTHRSHKLQFIHCGLVMPYSDNRIKLSQHWFWQWLIAWWFSAYTWTIVDLASARYSNMQLKAMAKGTSIINNWNEQKSIYKISLKFPRGKELTQWGLDEIHNISQMTTSNAFSSMKMFQISNKIQLKFVQIAKLQHWFR